MTIAITELKTSETEFCDQFKQFEKLASSVIPANAFYQWKCTMNASIKGLQATYVYYFDKPRDVYIKVPLRHLEYFACDSSTLLALHALSQNNSFNTEFSTDRSFQMLTNNIKLENTDEFHNACQKFDLLRTKIQEILTSSHIGGFPTKKTFVDHFIPLTTKEKPVPIQADDIAKLKKKLNEDQRAINIIYPDRPEFPDIFLEAILQLDHPIQISKNLNNGIISVTARCGFCPSFPSGCDEKELYKIFQETASLTHLPLTNTDDMHAGFSENSLFIHANCTDETLADCIQVVSRAAEIVFSKLKYNFTVGKIITLSQPEKKPLPA